MNDLPAWMYVDHMCAVLMETRRGHWTPQELELKAVVSGYVGAGN